MYEAFYGLRKRPFSILPDHAFFYAGETQQKALVRLKHGMMSQEGFTLITGEIGTGKTTLIGHLLSQAWASATVGQLTNTHPSLCGLLQWVLQAFKVPFDDTSDVRLYQAFIEFLHREAAQGRRVVLIVDEAQYLIAPIIEELRLLANVNVCDQVFQVILVGQPDLLDLLRQPELREVAQRVVVVHRLEPLEPPETGHYIAHRIRVAGGDPDFFQPEARALVHRHSLGVPRLINSICDTALLYGCEEQQRIIDTSLVSEVVFDSVRNALLAAPQIRVSEDLGALPTDNQLAPEPQHRSPFNSRSGESKPRFGRRKRTIDGTYSLVGEVVERAATFGQPAPQSWGSLSTTGREQGAADPGAEYSAHSKASLAEDATAPSDPVEDCSANDPDIQVQKMSPRPAPEKKWDLDGALNTLSGWLD